MLGFTVRTRDADDDGSVRAISLIEVEGRTTNDVIRALRGVAEIDSLHSTNGGWDLVAEIRTESLRDFDPRSRTHPFGGRASSTARPACSSIRYCAIERVGAAVRSVGTSPSAAAVRMPHWCSKLNADMGRPKRWPWKILTPSPISALSWNWVSTPSATTSKPSVRALANHAAQDTCGVESGRRVVGDPTSVDLRDLGVDGRPIRSRFEYPRPMSSIASATPRSRMETTVSGEITSTNSVISRTTHPGCTRWRRSAASIFVASSGS